MYQSVQRKKEAVTQTLIQPQLEIGRENDQYETEANQVADKVMRMTEPEGENKKMSTGGSIQRMTDPNSAKAGTMHTGMPAIQKMSDGGQSGMMAPAKVEQGINSSKGSGQSIQPEVQNELSSKIGTDLSNVNIHTDSNAVQMNKEIGAKAFTHGNDIYFNQGQYNPSSNEGKHLLAHELTHTVQQSGKLSPKIQRKTTFPFEGEIATMYNTPLFKSASTQSDRLIDLDRGTQVQVLAEEDGFYKVTAGDKTGYVAKDKIAKSIVGEIEDAYTDKKTMKWESSTMGVRPGTETTKTPGGKLVPPKGTSQFSKWAAGYQGFPAPNYTIYPDYGWSCWEMILQFAMDSGRVKESYIKEIYQTPWPQKTIDKLMSSDPATQEKGIKEGREFHNKLVINSLKAKGSYEQTYSVDNRPKAGDIVFFDGVTHVAIATGNYPNGETEILSLWNNPSNANAINKIQKTTIEDLSPYVLGSVNSTRKQHKMEEVKTISITWTIPPWVDDTVK